MNDIPRAKKIIYIPFVILAAIGVLWFIYNSLLPPTAPPQGGETNITGSGIGPQGGTSGGTQIVPPEIGSGGTAAVAEKRLIQISDFPVIGPSLNKTRDRILFYQKDGGDLFSSDFSGKNQEKISRITIIGLINAKWTRAGDNAAVFYLDGETLKGFLQKSSTSVVSLPQNIADFSWAPDGKSLAYFMWKDNLLNLLTADSDFRASKTIATTPILDAQLAWIKPDTIIFNTAPSGLAEGYLFSFSRTSASLKKILGPLFGLTSLWSPDGTRVLTGSTNTEGKNPLLSARDSSGKEMFSIALPTIPDKCAWLNNDEIYCAAPRFIDPGSVWPDDYYRGEVNTSDRILYLNLKTNDAKEILNEGDFDVSSMTLKEDGSYLFFINRNDGTLWSLKLK